MQRTYRDPGPPSRSTLGAFDQERAARARRRCVRCGELPPDADLFICADCHDDPDTMREVHNIEEGFTDPTEQRKALMLFGWAGGWWRR